MSTFLTEGLIKEVAIQDGTKVTFKLEPVAPYIFENKKDDGSTERCLLFVDNDKKDISKESKMAAYFHVAYVVQAKVEFEAKSGCVRTLLFAKANRMRVEVRIIVRDSQFPDKSSINVESFVVL